MEKDKVVYTITFEEIQAIAEGVADRRLTKSEVDEVVNELESTMGTNNLICEAVQHILTYKNLLNRNKNADKDKHHFLVYWKNTNVYQNEFTLRFSSKNLSDAQTYILSHYDGNEFDTWRITEKRNAVEKEIRIISGKLPHVSKN